MNDYVSKEIYRDNNPESARSLRVSLHDGQLYMLEQDVGPLVERFCGNPSYERFISQVSANELKKALGASSDEDLIDKISEKFGENSGFDGFATFMRDNGIKFEYGSY